ncbi:MAG: glycosyltransferase [Patescibacteria group bacterium]|nr:glycosyltransferase [Patescibacteria group bacterium]
MKIGFIGNNEYGIFPPEDTINTIQLMTGVLAEEMIKRNHDIIIFAPTINKLKPKTFISGNINAFFDDFSLDEWSLINHWVKVCSLLTYDFNLYLEMFLHIQKYNNIDIIHIHMSPFTPILPILRLITLPKIITLHTTINQFDDKIFINFLQKYQNLKNTYFISISKYQVSNSKIPHYAPVFNIYHGIDIKKFQFNSIGTERMVFISRINKIKGAKLAIDVAKKLKKKLFLKGRISTDDRSFFYEEILPIVDSNLITLDKNINRNQIPENFANSKLFLFPIQWEEPFGLVMIESMACGTPVVAFARGSVPEVVKDGETGFIVNPSDDDIRGNWIIKKTGIEGLCEAVERIYSMPEKQYLEMRRACRAHVEKHFTVERMVDDYEKVYQEILSKK